MCFNFGYQDYKQVYCFKASLDQKKNKSFGKLVDSSFKTVVIDLIMTY